MKVFNLFLAALLVAVVLSQGYYSTKVAKRMVQFSAISYESTSDIVNWNCDLCSTVAFADPIIINNGSVFGFIGFSPQFQKIVIAFRGSVDIANWVTNLKTTRTSYDLCDGCSVHVGFNQGYNSVKGQVESAINFLRGKHPLATVMVTGHSLGGALGVMAAAHIQDNYRLVEMLYTVGQPRVGNDKFAKFMGTFVPETYRIVDYADQIVHIPQSILGFKHFGWEAWYQRGMQEYKICPSESKDCSNQLSLLKMNQADHKIVLYLELKVEDSVLAEASSYLHFKWLRFVNRGRLHNLSIETMLEEDRQVKEAIQRHKNATPSQSLVLQLQ